MERRGHILFHKDDLFGNELGDILAGAISATAAMRSASRSLELKNQLVRLEKALQNGTLSQEDRRNLQGAHSRLLVCMTDELIAQGKVK